MRTDAANLADGRADDGRVREDLPRLRVPHRTVGGTGGAAGGEHLIGAAFGLVHYDVRYFLVDWRTGGLLHALAASFQVSKVTGGALAALLAHHVTGSLVAGFHSASSGVSNWAVKWTGGAALGPPFILATGCGFFC